MNRGCKVMSFLILLLVVLIGCAEAQYSDKKVLERIDEQTQIINNKFDEGKTERTNLEADIAALQQELVNRANTAATERQTMQTEIDGLKQDMANVDAKVDAVTLQVGGVQTSIDDFDVAMSTDTKAKIENIYGRLIVTQYELEETMKSFYTQHYGTQAVADLEANGYKNLWDIFNMEGGTTTIYMDGE